jgi:squalene-hopene/tetraprenyl-beta-curcumene cyclase
MIRTSAWNIPVTIAALLLSASSAMTTRTASAKDLPGNKQYEQAVQKAADYLRTKGQAADGSFSAQAGPAITAIVATGLLQNGRKPNDPTIVKAIGYLQGFVQPDGGIYAPGSRIKNYETCVNLLCFNAANANHKYDKIVKDADKFVRGLQVDGSDGRDKSNIEYGGVGYGNATRPDLSNTAFLIDALHATGAAADDEALQKALVFVSRCQNLESEHNTTPFAAKNPDGGFYYTPAAGGGNPSDKTPEGGLRSYGSMTYAGLKSMIFAGLNQDDPRVKAAYKWIQDNYDLDSNPGMGTAGLYYYYHLFAKSLDAIGASEIKDAAGKSHDWRKELIATLAAKQQADGSWVNDNKQWLEGDANLCTAFALLALAHCHEQPAGVTKPAVKSTGKPTTPTKPAIKPKAK